MTKRVAGAGHWTKTMRARFLDRLAATCDVAECAALIGVPQEAVHALRREDAAFAAAWDDALRLAHVMLETRAVAQALASDELTPAIKVLALRRDAGVARRAAVPSVQEIVSPEATDMAIMRKLAQIEARRAASA